MTIADLLIVVVLAALTLNGFRQGLIVQVAAIAGFLIGLVVARLEYRDVDHILSGYFPKGIWLTDVSYLLVVVLVTGAVVFLAQKTRFAARLLLFGCGDRLGGAVVGFVEGVVAVEVLLYLGRYAPNATIRGWVEHSALAPTFLNLVPHLHRLLPHLTA